MTTFQPGNTRARKLTGEQVMEIRAKYLSGLFTYGTLAKEYGVTLNTVTNIVKGHTWQRQAGAELVGQPRVPPQSDAATGSGPFDLEAARRSEERFVEMYKHAAVSTAPAPSLYEDAPPPTQGEPTGAGLERLNRLFGAGGIRGDSAAKLKVDEALDQFEKEGD